MIRKPQEGGEYGISTLSSPVEILKIIGKQAINNVFSETETLGIRNIRGEGCTLTQEEWVFISKELQYFPIGLTEFLFEPVSGATAKIVPKKIKQVLADFIVWLLLRHPLQGSIRVCNKLIPLLKG